MRDEVHLLEMIVLKLPQVYALSDIGLAFVSASLWGVWWPPLTPI